MKNLTVLVLMLFGSVAMAQNKNAKASMEVDGVCMMCKDRIEKACYKVKGVKSASWDVKTHELKLIYDENKTNLKTIRESIAAVGHDTKEIKATDEAYNSVHACCKYRDEKIVGDHKE